MMSSGDYITTSARMYPYEENQMHADMTRPKRPYMTDNIQSSQTQNQRCSADSLFERGNSKHHVETPVTQSRHCNTAHDTMISGGEHYNYPPSERSRPIPDATPVWNNRRSMHSGPFTKTPRFSGKEKWDTYIRQFSAIAHNNRWTQQQKLGQLLGALFDEAADFTFDLSPDILENYEHLVYSLEQRFRVVETRDSLQHQFHSRKLKLDENMKQYAASLKSLIIKAFSSGLSNQIREEMLMKQFFDGLCDDEVNFHVKYLKHPQTLDDAVAQVEKYYFYRKKNQFQKKSHVRNITEIHDGNLEEKIQAVKQKESPESEQIKKLAKNVEELTNIVSQLVKSEQSRQKKRDENKSNRNMNDVKCYACNENGHYANSCPNRKLQDKERSRSEKNQTQQKQGN